MSRYGVYPGNTSISTSTSGESLSDDNGSEHGSSECEGDGSNGSIRGPLNERPTNHQELAQDGTAPIDSTTASEEFSRQTSTTSTPTLELSQPPPLNSFEALTLASFQSAFQSGSMTPLERFAFNALIENHCANQISRYLSPNLPHHVHETYKRELFQRVMASFGMGPFHREEFQGVRDSVMDVINATINNEMIAMVQNNLLSSGTFSPTRQPEDRARLNMGTEDAENSVVRRITRNKSSDNSNPLPFLPPNRMISSGFERPATSDGRKGPSIYPPARETSSQTRETLRPELTRAISFDRLHKSHLGSGFKTPPLGGEGFKGGTSAFFGGYKSPQQSKSPALPSHTFKQRSFANSPPQDLDANRGIPPPNQRTQSAGVGIPRHISNVGALKASMTLQQQQARPALEKALSTVNVPKLQNSFTALSSQTIFTPRKSRYEADFSELEFLGKGGFASVYKARHHLDGRIYAVKKVPIRNKHLNYKSGEKLSAVFKEIKILAKLEHPHVVRYYNAWIEGADGLWDGGFGGIGSQLGTAKAIESSASPGLPLFDKENRSPAIPSSTPILDAGIIFHEEGLKDPLKFDFSEKAEDDSMGVMFGESTKASDEESASPNTDRAVIQEDSDSEGEVDPLSIPKRTLVEEDVPLRQDQAASHEMEDEKDSDDEEIEVIPRTPLLPINIPLPISPITTNKFPHDFLKNRRRSFVSPADEDGNELPFIESYARPASSGSDFDGDPMKSEIQGAKRNTFLADLRKKEEQAAKANENPFADSSKTEGEGTDGSEESSEAPWLGPRSKSPKKKRGAEKNGKKGDISKQPVLRERALLRAERLARRESDKKVILTLMIMMSCHPLTLKEFLAADHNSDSPTHDSYDLSQSQTTGYGAPGARKGKIEHIKHCWHLKGALKLFKGIVDGVDYLHKNGIVHRDLKPGNIFLNVEEPIPPQKGHQHYHQQTEHLQPPEHHFNPDLVVSAKDCGYCEKKNIQVIPRIGDFGLVADLVDGVRRASTDESTTTTTNPADELEDGVSGAVVGTVLYRPPPSIEDDGDDVCSSSDGERTTVEDLTLARKERRKKDRNIICPKTDVYALGILLFELLYRFTTGSERVKCLMDLREKRVLPTDWVERIEMFAGMDGVEGVKFGGGWKDGLMKIGECILGMTERRRAKRWGLKRVKEELEGMEVWQEACI